MNNEINYASKALEGIALNDHKEKRIYTEADFANIDKDELIFHLWRIIDNIDTFGDMVKSNDKAFRSLTEKEQRTRWNFAGQDFVDYLYDKYYHRSHKNGSPQAIESNEQPNEVAAESEVYGIDCKDDSCS